MQIPAPSLEARRAIAILAHHLAGQGVPHMALRGLPERYGLVDLSQAIPVSAGPAFRAVVGRAARTTQVVEGERYELLVDHGEVFLVRARGVRGDHAWFDGLTGSYSTTRARPAASRGRWSAQGARIGLLRVALPEEGASDEWLDWSHPETGRVGQCRRAELGPGWHQAPPDGAVLLVRDRRACPATVYADAPLALEVPGGS